MLMLRQRRTPPRSIAGQRKLWQLFVGSVIITLITSSLGYAVGVRGVLTPTSLAADTGCGGFADVAANDPACPAIIALVSGNIIKGYATTPPRFGPADPVQRAQVATFLVRALGWQARSTGPRSFADLAGLTGELRTASLILANVCDAGGSCVVRGYDENTFGPSDPVTHVQVISFIARTFHFDPNYSWQFQSSGASPYSGVPDAHQRDVLTYHHYAGAIPGVPTNGDGWNGPAPRAWVARVLFQALNIPSPTSPQPSPMPPSAIGVCGEDMVHWHAPVINGCATGHEHGDTPPGWVMASRWMPMFEHPGNTPSENQLKHSGFKGFVLRDDGVDVYIIIHLDSNPNGHTSRFHSVQVWARDATGTVSYWDLWADFGTGNMTGPQLRGNGCQDTEVRPIMAVNYSGCGALEFESWYSRAGAPRWGWDFGFNLKPQYYSGTTPQSPSIPDLGAIGTWIPTGELNDVRRVEAAWYAFRAHPTGTFYSTQWGELVSGPGDARCGQPRTFGTKTYTTLCLQQHIAPTMTTVSFPDNSIQRDYPTPGVKLPN